MDAVTYPNDAVITFIEQNVVPLHIHFGDQTLAKKFHVHWTPALLVTDRMGKTQHRAIGFWGPEELIPFIRLGIAKMHFASDKIEDAIIFFEKVLKQHPGSYSAPEAVFRAGVSRYKTMNEPQYLKEAYDYLLKEYPWSSWTNQASPYRFL